MSVAKVSEISATSSKSFGDAIQQGLNRGLGLMWANGSTAIDG